MLRRGALLCAAAVAAHPALSASSAPRGIHLGLTSDADAVTISWHTEQATLVTAARMTAADNDAQQLDCDGTQAEFEASPTRSTWLHTVTCTGLVPGAEYEYRVSGGNSKAPSDSSWSPAYRFRAPSNASASAQLLAFCDAGVVDGQRSAALDAALADSSSRLAGGGGAFDAVLHCGDFAYDMHDQDGRLGEQFLENLEPLIASVPYLTAPGNHEVHGNMSHYKAHFTEQLFWSRDIGPVHLVSYNTEVFFWPQYYGADNAAQQHSWLDADLAAADANRAAVPWIVVSGHRPMYCTWPDRNGVCDGEHEASRQGLMSTCSPLDGHLCTKRRGAPSNLSVEALLHKHGVDVAIFGHIHIYSRSWPVYDEHVLASGGLDAYTDPPATVHMVTGAGGNREMKTGSRVPPHGQGGSYTAFQSGYAPADGQSADYSYSRVTVHNATTLEWEQVSGTFGGVIDHFFITRTRGIPSFGERWTLALGTAGTAAAAAE